MSHEIRTPLNGVIGLNDLLLRSPLNQDQQRLASGVQVASRALLSVINDILDFSKIEAGKLELECLDFEIRPVFDQVASVLAEAARAKGLELIVSCHPDVPEVLAGDPTRLAQVLTNLGSNAVKFTKEGEVFIRATAAAAADGRTQLRVAVADTGVGVPEVDIDMLFEAFTQADASTTRQVRRHRARTGDLARDRRRLRRRDRPGAEPGRRQHLLVHRRLRRPERSGRRRGRRVRAQLARRATRARRGRQRAQPADLRGAAGLVADPVGGRGQRRRGRAGRGHGDGRRRPVRGGAARHVDARARRPRPRAVAAPLPRRTTACG